MRGTRERYTVPRFDRLPERCPECLRRNGLLPQSGNWVRHRLSGFQGVQCAYCGFLVAVKSNAAPQGRLL